MAEETQPQAAAAAPAAEAAPEVVAAEKAPAEVEEPAVEAETEESAAVADDGGAVEATGSFKEESNLVADLPDPEKKALDEFKELIVAALAAGEFNLPPPPPPPKAKTEEPAKAEEPAKTEEPAKEEPKTEEPKAEEPAKEEPKVEVVAEAAAAEQAKEEPKAEEAKPPEPKTQEVTAEEVTKTAEAAAEAAAAATSEQTPAPEAEADAVAPPEPVFIWGVPLVGDDERTDAVLLKFLRAREFKVKEAMAMLRSAVLWRKRFGIDSLLEADLAFPELEKVVFYRGADRESHPVCYNVYGEFQDKDLYEKAFGDEEKRERFLKWRIQLLERGILSQLDFAPSGICSMVQVTDLKNSPPMLGKHRAVTRQAVALLQDNYPEFIAKKVFINVPWWYLAANKMMSPFLTQRTRSKFVFASQAKSPETLFRYIAPEQVPVQFGGLYKEDDPEFTTSDSVTELTIKASSKETIEIPVTENSTIVWELRVLGWEVSYGAEFTPDAEGGYTVIVQKTRKVPANEEPIMKGSFKVTEAGKIALTINNPASKKKKLLYRSKVKSTSESI
ncbi:hypothetical protein ACQ4PT_011812 [Festuca glaucescens]